MGFHDKSFFSISGKLGRILLKIINNNDKKYFYMLIIKKLAFEKTNNYCCICDKFLRNDAQNLYYFSDNNYNKGTRK